MQAEFDFSMVTIVQYMDEIARMGRIASEPVALFGILGYRTKVKGDSQ